MPLPDADKKSPRVYTNLQNLDLDSVTFANIQDTGNPIAVEEMNEDEMRRLVLVNLARLVTAGEWTGLLSAGGGGNWNPVISPYDWDGDDDAVRIFALPPFGTVSRNLNETAVQDDEIALYPFIAPTTGTISQVDFFVGGSPASGTGAINVGFYSDEDGLPKTFIGEFVLDCTSVGQVTQTTSSADVDTILGTQYWVGFYADNVGSTPNFANMDWQDSGAPPTPGTQYGSGGVPTAIFKASAGGNATITDYTTFSPNTNNPINIGVKW